MITEIDGLRVGHYSDKVALTGCTVLLFDSPVVGGVDIRGTNASTRETNLLRPEASMPYINGILLTGGSSFGHNATEGVVKFLEEKGYGFDVGVAKIPIVPTAVIYDLSVGVSTIRPNAEMGYLACINAKKKFERGSVGVGTGATFGKLYGYQHCTKGGIGTSCIELDNKLKVGALVVLNAFGDIIDPSSKKILGGSRNQKGKFVGTLAGMKKGHSSLSAFQFTNTILGAIYTNARLTKKMANRIATLAHNGIANIVSPAHTEVDGDVIFVAGQLESEKTYSVDLIGSMAVEAIVLALLDAMKSAKSLGGFLSYDEF